MRAIYLTIPSDAFERLRDLADLEFRGTKEQAVVLILEGLERRGTNKARADAHAPEAPRSER
jgi:hypothetical protein